jgi:mono/diheme cytochrome c family protein
MTDLPSPIPFSLRSWTALLGAALLVTTGAARSAEPAPVEFNRDIRPILSDNCFSCHGPDKAKRKAKLRLDTEEGAFADLGGRRALVPGDPARSELIARVTAEDETERMPPPASGRKLTPQQIDLLRRWVAEGAKWQKHWTFLAPRRPPLPAVRNLLWERDPIDAFVLARLEREGLAPSPEAGKETLIRRVSLDLTGLPPTPAEVDAFLADASPGAYEKAVDRLLASPRYGEHMAVEWLDAARYADTNGYQGDNTRTLWPWRDWLIGALNRNMPFDQFTIEQIAGDLLPGAGREQKVATGLHRNHMINGEGGRIAEESRVDYVVDRVDTTATIWLGLTLGCCRCHDHKYDPFTQKEYYQLFAYFNNVAESGGVDRGGNAAPVLALTTEEQAKRQAELTKAVAEQDGLLKKIDEKHPPTREQWQRQALVGLVRMPAPFAALLALPDNVLTSLPEREPILKKRGEARQALDAVNRSIVQTMVMEERQPPRETFVLVRGQYDKYAEKVGPGVPAPLSPLPKDATANRLGLAKWLVDPANPLTARVTVNRAWQHFFGTGLVKTTEDFGVQGEAPSHPELLDWLAVEFRELGWDVKALHKRIVTSATYRQSSRLTPELRERDPDNRLLARGPRLRLSSLALRDQALAVSGLLVEKVGGPPVKPYQPPGIWEEMSFGKTKYVQDHGENLYRRSLYTFWRRAVPPTTMFDTASRQVCTVRPSRTNTPLHALILLNDVTFVEAARVLAERLLKQGGNDEERITLLFRLATARKPSDAEMQVLTQALERLRKQYGADRDAALKLVGTGEAPRKADLDVVEHAAYTGLASLVLNLDEVISKE